MDSSSFDRLARRLAAPASRRGALAGLGAVIARFLAPEPAAAQPRTTCRELGKVCILDRNIDCCPGTTCQDGRCACPAGKRRCGRTCIPATRCCNDNCGGGSVCRNDRCVCPNGKKRCQGRCIPKAQCCRDGECGPNRECRNGRCVARPEPGGCPTGTKRCNGSCIPDDACCGGCAAGLTCRDATCCNVTTGAELEALITAGPDVIRLCPNTTYVGHFFIQRNLTIVGSGMASSILSGDGSGRVVTIDEDTEVTLRQLRVTNGIDDQGGGGGIRVNNDTTLTLEDVEVSGNEAANFGFGGGINVGREARLNLRGVSRVANNVTGSEGGGIFADEESTIELFDTSEVAGNTAYEGGGIYADEANVTLRNRSRIHANFAGDKGGGIVIRDARLELRDQSAVTNNQATRIGGGIFVDNAVAERFNQAVVTNNTPDQCVTTGGGTCAAI